MEKFFFLLKTVEEVYLPKQKKEDVKKTIKQNTAKGKKDVTCGCHYKIHNCANVFSIHMLNCCTQDVARLTLICSGGFCCCCCIEISWLWLSSVLISQIAATVPVLRPYGDFAPQWRLNTLTALLEFFFSFLKRRKSRSTSTSAAPGDCMTVFTQWKFSNFLHWLSAPGTPPFVLNILFLEALHPRCKVFPSSPPFAALSSSFAPPLHIPTATAHHATHTYNAERRQFSEGRVVLHSSVIQRMSGREWWVGGVGGVAGWDWDGWTEAWEADRRFKLFHLNAVAHQRVITARLSNKTSPTPSSKCLFSMVL